MPLSRGSCGAVTQWLMRCHKAVVATRCCSEVVYAMLIHIQRVVGSNTAIAVMFHKRNDVLSSNSQLFSTSLNFSQLLSTFLNFSHLLSTPLNFSQLFSTSLNYSYSQQNTVIYCYHARLINISYVTKMILATINATFVERATGKHEKSHFSKK